VSEAASAARHVLVVANETVCGESLINALRSRGAKVKIVGFDWSPTTLAALGAGQIDSLVIQNPFQMGYEAVTACVKAINKQPVQKQINLNPRLITQQNLNDPDVQQQVKPDLKQYLGG